MTGVRLRSSCFLGSQRRSGTQEEISDITTHMNEHFGFRLHFTTSSYTHLFLLVSSLPPTDGPLANEDRVRSHVIRLNGRYQIWSLSEISKEDACHHPRPPFERLFTTQGSTHRGLRQRGTLDKHTSAGWWSRPCGACHVLQIPPGETAGSHPFCARARAPVSKGHRGDPRRKCGKLPPCVSPPPSPAAFSPIRRDDLQ